MQTPKTWSCRAWDPKKNDRKLELGLDWTGLELELWYCTVVLYCTGCWGRLMLRSAARREIEIVTVRTVEIN